jgi:hypothetical protein
MFFKRHNEMSIAKCLLVVLCNLDAAHCGSTRILKLHGKAYAHHYQTTALQNIHTPATREA